jgi:hypothetical protein
MNKAMRENREQAAAFEKDPMNVPMTTEITSIVRRALPPAEAAAVSVECRLTRCRAILGSLDARQPLVNASDFKAKAFNVNWPKGKTVFFDVKTAEVAAAEVHLTGLLAGFPTSPAIAECGKRFPDALGWVQATFAVPASGTANADGVKDRISVSYAGQLAGTPAGKCLGEVMEAAVLAKPLPKGLGAWTGKCSVKFADGTVTAGTCK